MSTHSVGDTERPTLVLAPGMLCDDAVWTPLAQSLGGEADLVFAHYGEARGIEAMARAVLAQAPARFALAGHSMGGRIAMEAARIAPDRVTRLALLSADCLPKPGGAAGEAETRGRYGLLNIARTEGMAAVAERLLPTLVPKDRLGEEALTGPIKAMIARQTPDMLERQIALSEQRVGQSDVLAGLAVPLLLICGDQDGFGRAPFQAEMAALAPDATAILVEHCGHMVTLEAPATVEAAIRRWLFDPA
jgi:pimeloyl-ACP methyl ester carboxylesterase